MKSPCMDCVDRHNLCHMECEKYREFRGTLDELNRKKAKENLLRVSLIERIIGTKNKKR